MLRARVGGAMVWTVVTVGCSSFVGVPTAPRSDVATPDDSNAATGDVSHDRPPVWSWCGLTFSQCDPGTQSGCATGAACIVDGLRPPRAHCDALAAGSEGARCGEGVGACGPRLLCSGGRCLRSCCYDSTRDSCGEGSSCAVITEATFVRGCVLRGECDYRAQTGCTPGDGCFPQSEFGEARCRPFGAARVGQRCTLPNDCVAGHTCFYAASTSIYCARICDPQRDDDPTCDCSEFNNRPQDFGACR